MPPSQAAVRLALGGMVAIVGISYAILAAAHIRDRYSIDFVSGVWLALADYAVEGTLYPAIHDDGHYGGTRYMPLPVLLDAAALKLTEEVVLSAKVVTYLGAIALFVLTWLLLRQVRCPPLLASLLTAAVVVTPTGLLGTLGVRNDSLAVVFQLAALIVVLRRRTNRAFAFSGVLSALAIFSKTSAVWAPAAIVIWSLLEARRGTVRFLAAFGASLLILTLTFEVLSGGRFLTNIAEFTFAGGRGPASPLTEGVRTLVTKFATYADAVWVLFPLAAVAILHGLRARRPTLLQFALLANLAVLCVVMAGRGTDYNHLLDLCVLTPLVAGEFAASRTLGERRSLVALITAVVALWGVTSSYQRMMGSETVGAVRRLINGPSGTNPSFEPNPLGSAVLARDRILSEDPTIPLLLGLRPVLVDAFTARAAFSRRPDLARRLAARITAQEFDKIILVNALAPGTEGFERQFLGPTVNDAMQANYHQTHAIVGFYLYVRNGTAGAA